MNKSRVFGIFPSPFALALALALFLAILVPLFVLVVGKISIDRYMDQPMQVPQEGFVFEVGKGSSLSKVAFELAQQKILEKPRWLLFSARFSEQGNTILAGEYRLKLTDTPGDLFRQLVTGEVITYSVTLIEGWNYKQSIQFLHRQPKLVKKISIEDQGELLARLGIADRYRHPEGLFFPDTYRYHKGMSDLDILRTAHQRMTDILESEWQRRQDKLPYRSAYEALVMASLVEKETGLDNERQIIAGVFVNRLNYSMRLQTDPTVVYGLGQHYDGNLTRKHLRQQTPYNTYMIKGLPPTPIALPGKEAIYAALNPVLDGSLYFVAKGDGSHQFSNTIEEHNRAVQQYQKNRRSKSYRSSPIR